MKAKTRKLIRSLLDRQPKTAAVLADELNVSVRSIKNYVREINIEYPDSIKSSYKGYEITTETALTILSNSTNHIPQTSEERSAYIINEIVKKAVDGMPKVADVSENAEYKATTEKISALEKEIEEI